MKTATLLRYPGGKTWLLPYIKKFIEFHNIPKGIIIEPFAGSGSVTTGLLSEGIMERGIICEKDPIIVAFWKSALHNNEEFRESLQNLEVNIDTWWDYKKYLRPDASNTYNEIEIATAFLFYNRVNYSGILKAGPIGGKSQKSQYTIACRFNKDRISKKLASLADFAERIEVIEGNGISLIEKLGEKEKEQNYFFYIDPPYFKAGKVLYRDYFNEDEHVELSKVVKSLFSPWLVSYGDHEFTNSLYRNEKCQGIPRRYDIDTKKRVSIERVYSNYDLPEIKGELKI